jgi:hypothetical protein
VCTPYTQFEDNCNNIPNCNPEIAVATITMGSAPVHVGTLTGVALYTAVSEALELLCPSVTQTTTSTQCTATGQIPIGNIPYVSPDHSLEYGSLVVQVPTSGYNIISLRNAMIASISLSIQASATGSNCFKQTYEVMELKRRDGLLGWIDNVPRYSPSLLGLSDHGHLNSRDNDGKLSTHDETITLCNAAYFHSADYSDPFWRLAAEPGPSDFIEALFTFNFSNSGNFFCEFLDMLSDALTLVAPEYAVADVEAEEAIDSLCCLADGGCQLQPGNLF